MIISKIQIWIQRQSSGLQTIIPQSFVCSPQLRHWQSLCSCSLSGLNTESFCIIWSCCCLVMRGASQQQRSWRSEHFAERRLLLCEQTNALKLTSERAKERRNVAAAVLLLLLQCSNVLATIPRSLTDHYRLPGGGIELCRILLDHKLPKYFTNSITWHTVAI